jgi:PilZ domain
VGNLPELRLERRTHFRGRARDGRLVGLRFRPLGNGGDGNGDGAAEWVSTQVRDLGVGGAFVATYRSLPVGTALEVEVDLPGSSGPLALRAEVRWLAEPGRLPPGCDAGMGVAFGPLDVDALLALSEYLAGLGRAKPPE